MGKEKENFLKIHTSSVGIWKQNSCGLLFAVSVCAGIVVVFLVKKKNIPGMFKFFCCFFSSNYIPVHVARGLKAPGEGAGRAGFNAEAEEKQRTLSSRRGDVFGGIPLVCCHAANRQAGLRKPRERYP